LDVVILPDAAAVCTYAARVLASTLRAKPAAVLGLATGETPKAMYAELVRLHRAGRAPFARATTFNLDEFVAVPADHPASYRHYMRAHLFDHVDIDRAHAHVPAAPTDADVPTVCARYEDAIRAAGGIDVQVLGLGRDGHIGFNEPTSSLASRTRLKTLTSATIEAARASWAPDEPPRHVITMGVATILEARRCVLLATGAAKAAATAAMIEGPLTAMVPASALQMHARATILVDEAAASQLKLASYYRDVQRHKPTWQREHDDDDADDDDDNDDNDDGASGSTS
jgi:glucosamine-6-phosphate deaminase